MYTEGPQSSGNFVVNCMDESLFDALIMKMFSFLMMLMLSFSFVGILFIFRSPIPPQFKPMRHVLNSDLFHFVGGASGSSEMSNSSIIVGLLLSMLTVKSSMVLMAMGVVNTWLKKVLPSRSFQNFILNP